MSPNLLLYCVINAKFAVKLQQDYVQSCITAGQFKKHQLEQNTSEIFIIYHFNFELFLQLANFSFTAISCTMLKPDLKW